MNFYAICVIFLLLRSHTSDATRILGLFIHPAISHFRAFQSVLRELAVRGHEVIVVSHFSEKNKPENYKELLLDQEVVLTGTAPVDEVYAPRNFYIYYKEFYALMNEGTEACEAFFNSDHISTLFDLNKEKKFEILITEYFNTDCVLGLAYKLNITKFIGMSSCALMPWHYERIGLPQTPSYIPNEFVGFSSKMNFHERLVNWLVVTLTKIGYRYQQIIDNARVKKYLGDEIPDLNDLAKTTNLLFVNQHFSISGVKPFPASVIEIGGVHIKESKNTLPNDIQKILNNAKHGVLYVSWGSIISPTGMPEDKKQNIVNAFKKLPQTILWKWENDSVTATAKNIHIRNWFPQTDILCHEKVVAFLSHGGMMGVSEAVHCKKPTIVTPIYGDQYLNAAALKERGMGVILNYDELSEEKIYESIVEILKPSYKEAAEKVSNSFKNRLTSPLETAIYWIEYLANTDGNLIKSHAVELNYFTYHSFDVLLFIFILIFLPIFLIFKFFKSKKSPENERKLKIKKTK
ncbi:hypothetical protein PVAND_015777 [Polypedilum vanderplanki]|uniref:UDP-glucuronosyltransferase n=1 Tax=Polypedilum vanderplanki TaxID=319348 RepID=A0A9J6BDY7_POLVA|nr:hypothetical protein PVAND_015777 [Polypedilum vanderplanki]